MGRKVAVLARAERQTHREPSPPRPPAFDDEFDADEALVEVPGDVAPQVEVESDESADDSLEADGAPTDNVGEQSIEINVESLIAELEEESQRGAPDVQCARRKLEDYLERKRIAHDLEDFEDFVVEE